MLFRRSKYFFKGYYALKLGVCPQFKIKNVDIFFSSSAQGIKKIFKDNFFESTMVDKKG